VAKNEAQTRRDLIDPKLFQQGWLNEYVKVEVTPGGTDIIDGKPVRRKGRSDYLLCIPVMKGQPPLPVAILEAKRESASPTMGMQQAQTYSRKFNVPFAFSTNGHMFAEYGEDKRQIIEYATLDEFPTPDDLRARYEQIKQIQLASEQAKALLMKYKGGEAIRFYFQDAAIRAILENIARGKKRILLSLATGTGKTFIAKQLLWKMAQAGQLRRALFLVDRDELRTQAITHMQGIFGDDAQEITTKNPKSNAKILISTYQTLNITSEDDKPQFWKENFPPNYFSHIIVDECHRSAWGKWSIVLRDNPDAIHIGLTATPRIITGGKEEEEAKSKDEEITAHNIEYFGEPVYEYSISQGQEDGYLAACEVIKRFVDIDAKVLTREQIAEKTAFYATTGKAPRVEDIQPAYTANQYEKSLLLDDRVRSMSEDLFRLLLDTGGPHQKTIIFCASDPHAEHICIRMSNLYNQWCLENGYAPKEMYAFQCTASQTNPGAKDLIAEFRGSSNSHFIATTVELLSTGVDVPNLNNVVFFKYVNSPISFYQMVGRGTRVGEPRGSKMMFRIYDYTNATRLFGEEFISRPAPSTPDEDRETPEPKKIIRVANNQFQVHIQAQGKSILCEEDGRQVLVPYEIYKERLAARISEKLADLDALRLTWVNPLQRREFLDELPGGESAVRLVRELEEEQECDLYDVLAQLGFGYIPKTRLERAVTFGFKNKQWLKTYPDRTQNVLVAIAGQFAKGGIEELETENLFDTAEVLQKGGFEALIGLPKEPKYFIEQTKLRLLA